MLLSADKRAGNEEGSASHQMDSKEAQSQLQTGQDLIKALADTAQQHKAMLPVGKTTEAKPDKLPVMMSFAQAGKSLQAVDAGGASEYVQQVSQSTAGEAADVKKKYFQLLVNGEKNHGHKYSVVEKKSGVAHKKGLCNNKGKSNPFDFAKDHEEFDFMLEIDSFAGQKPRHLSDEGEE